MSCQPLLSAVTKVRKDRGGHSVESISNRTIRLYVYANNYYELKSLYCMYAVQLYFYSVGFETLYIGYRLLSINYQVNKSNWRKTLMLNIWL